MSKHTPGPWKVHGPYYGEDVDPEEPGKQWLSIDDAEDDELAVLVNRLGEPSAQQYADARLIAAAPDLLAALEELITLADDGAFIDLADIEATPISQKLRAAIAAAKETGA